MPPPDPDSLLHVEAAGDAVVVRLAGEAFYEENVGLVGERLFRLADGLGPRALRLDLAAVGFLSSTGLGMLWSLHKRVAAAGGRLSLTRVAPLVYEVFEVTQLTSRLEVHRAGAEDAETA
jgi:anti-anti-sigma factor